MQLLEDRVFLEYRIPETIIAGNGRQFISNLFKGLLEKYKVSNLFYNCYYHPQNNPTERMNKIIISAVRSYVCDNHRRWDKNISKITVRIRTLVNVITGYTPFYFNSGREFIFAGGDHKLYDIEANVSKDAITDRTKFLKSFNQVKDDIIRRMILSYNRNKKYFDI